MMNHFTRASLCLVAVFIVFSNSSFAKSSRKPAAQNASADLMTYQQLMSLTPAQRVAYIKDVREVLVLLEQMEIKARQLSYQSAEASGLREKIAAIASLLAAVPEAKAEDGGDTEDKTGPENSFYVIPVLKGKTWTCVSSGSQANYSFNTSVGTCIRDGSVITKGGTADNHGSSSYYYDSGFGRNVGVERSCNRGETAVYVSNSETREISSSCAANSSMAKMNQFRATELKTASSPPASSADLFSKPGLSTSRVTVGRNDPPQTAADVAVGGVKTFSAQGPVTWRGQTIPPATGPSEQESLLKGDPGPAAAAIGATPAQVAELRKAAGQETQSPATNPPPHQDQPARPSKPDQLSGGNLLGDAGKTVKTEKIKGGPEEAALTEDAKKLHKKEEAVPMVEKPAKPPIIAGNECKPLQASDMNGVRGQWAKVKDKTTCVNAGNFSNYSEVAEGKCDPVHKAQNYPDNLLYVGMNGAPLKRQDRGCGTAELCAPEVFCDSSDNEKDPTQKVKAFCVPMTGKDDEYKTKAYTQLCNKAVLGKKCDPMSIKGPTQEAWKQLAASYKKNHDTYCAGTTDENKNFRNFFCAECKAIADRLKGWSKVTAALAPAVPVAAPASPIKPFQNYQMPSGGYDSTKSPGSAQ